MRIFDIRARSEGDRATLSGRIQPDGVDQPIDLWFRFSGLDGPLTDYADPFVAAMLPTCMREGESCTVAAPISSVLRRNVAAAQTVLGDWYDYLKPTIVEASRYEPMMPDNGHIFAHGVACCFSGGVDSWYSLLRNRHEISHLLLVRGFDIGLDNDALWNATYNRLQEVAEEMGLGLITCETNLRAVADPRHNSWGKPFDGDFWGHCLHGAALSAVTLALSRTVSSLIIPATHKEAELKPWGSSPFLDAYWSNGKVGIFHHGCDAGRVEKVFSIAREPAALRSLRVCHNDVADMNCGVCEKCVRTMLALDLCGALRHAETFPHTGALRKLRRMNVPAHLNHHYEALLATARRMGEEQLERELEIILGRRFSSERVLARTVRAARQLRDDLRIRVTGDRPTTLAGQRRRAG